VFLSRLSGTTIENDETVVEISPAHGTMRYILFETGDVNGDGTIDFEDLAVLIRNRPEDTTL
jgi:hypothetical protein